MIDNKQMRGLIEGITSTLRDAIIWIDVNSRIVEWNSSAEQLFGFQREDVIGRSLVNTIIPDDQRENHLRGMARFINTGVGPRFGRTTEVSALTWSGNVIKVSIFINTIAVAGEQYFTSQIRSSEL